MINSDTDLYCIFGNPVKHSKSPLIHNSCFRDKKINAFYLSFEPCEIAEGIRIMKYFDIKGASVTIPFKETVMDHLDWVDDEAAGIGAVNTLANRDGRLFGYNTDSRAAVEALKEYGIRNKAVCIIGAGGAARAAAFGIRREGGDLIIANRTVSKGKELALEHNADFIPLSEIGRIRPDIVINTTPVGMSSDIDQTVIPPEFLTGNMIVMDMVYSPLRTKLLTEAENRGCVTVDGLSMFISQGAAQFELWTGIKPDSELMRNVLTGRVD